MKIDNTSMFFNASIKDGSATAAWGTSVGQSRADGYKINESIDGVVDLIIGMNYKINSDIGSLDISKGSDSRELLYFSIFEKVFIDGNELDDCSFILLFVKEHTSSHNGRLIVSYPPYAEYKSGSAIVKNSETINRMAAQLKCKSGCWFVYDISIKNQEELHFSSVVVDKNPVQYLSSRDRKELWENLVESKKAGFPVSVPFDVASFTKDMADAGLIFDDKLVYRFVSSLLVKPFLILTGLSGSGKTKIAQAFVQWICRSEQQYCIIPVGADWTNREPLLGYPNALKPEEYIRPDNGVLDLLIHANSQKDIPHFLVLDEMNLSHVERYFADFLSVMESKAGIPLNSKLETICDVPANIHLPSNLYIIGTVNIDETTNMFSPKVLDRANTIEFRVSHANLIHYLKNVREIDMDIIKGRGANMATSFLNKSKDNKFAIDEEISKILSQFFVELSRIGAEFGYRSTYEMLKLTYHFKGLNNKTTMSESIDIAIAQKVLPKLHGSRRKLCPILETLGQMCVLNNVNIQKDVFDVANFDFNCKDVLYPVSLEKIARMYKGAIENGFASFAEA